MGPVDIMHVANWFLVLLLLTIRVPDIDWCLVAKRWDMPERGLLICLSWAVRWMKGPVRGQQ
eukprot:6714106-Alexandrium_andersonii.AAC.1